MTEAEWLAATDTTPMLEFVRGKATDRKLRLFAVACCRVIWHLLSAEESKAAAEKADQYAEQSTTQEQLKEAYFAASPDKIQELDLVSHTAAVVAQYAAWAHADDSAWYAAERAGFISYRYISTTRTRIDNRYHR